jgi:hypothetical protein
VAATSEEAFKVFLSWLLPRDEVLGRAATHRDEIRARLDRKLGVHKVYEGGSLHHRTGLHSVSGADYFCWLQMKRPASSQGALKVVAKSLQALYPKETVRVVRPAVVIDFAGGEERVGVIPAFAGSDGLGAHERLKIPGIAQEWTSASPSAYGEWLERCNSVPGVVGGAKGLARLARAWKHFRDVPISSFYLETRAAQFMTTRRAVVYPYDLRDFLVTLAREELPAIDDPAGIAGMIEPLPDPAKREEALSRLANAAGWADSALTQQRLGETGQSFRQWNLLFGGRFPSCY